MYTIIVYTCTLFFCTSRNQLISDEAYSFGDMFLNAERDERTYLVSKDTTSVSILYMYMVFVSIMAESS